MPENFFERQRVARRTSIKLVVLFGVAVVAMVVVMGVLVVMIMAEAKSEAPGWFVVSTVGTLLVIGGGMLFKTVALRGGGAAVAASLGAVPVDPTSTDPQLRRLVNVVEEMALASGVPVPRVFVLAQEPGINAFAAGYAPADAAITVTQGALAQLSRDELQGVIGHEFSHVLGGDMRLNIRLIGLLHGILLLHLIGRWALDVAGRTRPSKGKGGNPIVLVAFAAMVVGSIGHFFAGLIKAAVSRQREWLADASAVQFTRQPGGLAGALKKIAGLPAGSALADKRGAAEVSHMLFGDGSRTVSRLAATHPPVLERIAALDSSFRPEELAELAQSWPVDVGVPLAVAPAEVVARAGTLTTAALAHGAALSAQIPPELRQLAGQPSTAAAVVLAMLVSAEPIGCARQLAVLARRLGVGTAGTVASLARETAPLPPPLRLPVLDIALPQLAARPREEQQALTAALDELSFADGGVTLFEYCLTRVVWSTVADAADPARRSRPGRTPLDQVTGPASTVLAALAAAGGGDPAARERAFRAAFTHLRPGAPVPAPAMSGSWRELDATWPALDGLAPGAKERLVEAMVLAVLDDGKLTTDEAELLRAACALVHVPLPALLA